MTMKVCSSWKASVALAISLLVFGPISMAELSPNLRLQTEVERVNDSSYQIDPLVQSTVLNAAAENGITTTANEGDTEATYINMDMFKTSHRHSDKRISATSDVFLGESVGGTSYMTFADSGAHGWVVLSDGSGRDWTLDLDGWEETDEGFLLTGYFQELLNGVVINESGFEGILGFDGILTIPETDENAAMNEAASSLASYFDVSPERAISVAAALVFVIVIVAAVIVVCTAGWLLRWFTCDASNARFPSMVRLEAFAVA